ncbi:MAG: glycosyltransferase, partial [Pirellulales bacterium]
MSSLIFGVLSYLNDSPADSSGNLGDSIQSLAALNCYKHALRLDMPFAEFLERVVTDTVPGARFVFVNRDASRRQQLPSRVVTLVNGWFMHPGRSGELDWPMHESILPVFASFHLADDRLLTRAGIEYFKRFEPIGCRDDATVEKLRSRGIDAYFTGCLTLTIDFLPWKAASSEELFVDVQREGRPVVRHWDPLFKNRDPAAMLRRAYAHLQRYSGAQKVTTSRLHCFLPCIAMGVPVTLTEVDLQDPRLRGVDAWDYAELKHRLAHDVRDRLAQLVPAPEGGSRPTYDVCFAFDEHQSAHVPIAVHSIVHNNRHAAIRVHLVHPEGISVPVIEGVEVRSYPVQRSRPNAPASGDHAGRLRVLIPEVIRADIRLLYLDVDVVVNMSVEPVFAMDPGPTGLAMRSLADAGETPVRERGADELTIPTHDCPRPGDTGVMLMDLGTLRRSGFTQFCLSHSEDATDRLLINRYCAGEHAELRREWNLLVPADSGVVADADQYILHYAGPEKPWSNSKPDHWQVWYWYARRMSRQAA